MQEKISTIRSGFGGAEIDAFVRSVQDAGVQLAGLNFFAGDMAPGRNQPGTGSLPLAQRLTALRDAGYAGWVGLEYKPTGASADSFDWASRTSLTRETS